MNEQICEFVPAVRKRIAQVVVGQDVVVERLLVSLFTGGHILLQGMPGLAKTLLVNTLAKTIETFVETFSNTRVKKDHSREPPQGTSWQSRA